jgi:hypothetical protein
MRVSARACYPLLNPSHGTATSRPRAQAAWLDWSGSAVRTGRRACWGRLSCGRSVVQPLATAGRRPPRPGFVRCQAQAHNRTLLRHHLTASIPHRYGESGGQRHGALPAFVTTWLGTRLLLLAVRSRDSASRGLDAVIGIVQASCERALTVRVAECGEGDRGVDQGASLVGCSCREASLLGCQTSRAVRVGTDAWSSSDAGVDRLALVVVGLDGLLWERGALRVRTRPGCSRRQRLDAVRARGRGGRRGASSRSGVRSAA